MLHPALVLMAVLVVGVQSQQVGLLQLIKVIMVVLQRLVGTAVVVALRVQLAQLVLETMVAQAVLELPQQ